METLIRNTKKNLTQDANTCYYVNDIHSGLNQTKVSKIFSPNNLEDVRDFIQSVWINKSSFSISGGRHSMGGQQFLSDEILLDTRNLNRILDFDRVNGIMEVEAGIQWDELTLKIPELQNEMKTKWGIRQKQTGADRLTIGGSISANAHGRCLTSPPIANDIEELTIVNYKAELIKCSRTENKKLFQLVIGGFGLFGFIYSAKLRLTARKKVKRIVTLETVDNLINCFEARIKDGFTFGDFQFSCDENSEKFMKEGVFSCYLPVGKDEVISENQKILSEEDWRGLLHLAHTNKSMAYEKYAAYYLSTSDQVYWSDTHQLSTYLDDYHKELDLKLGSSNPCSEMITELYVPFEQFIEFMNESRNFIRQNKINIIYSSIRIIEKDELSFLPWAKQKFICIVLNLHVEHTREGKEKLKNDSRFLIDIAISKSGSFFLTYHRNATRAQVEYCYPQFSDFLKLKKVYDPEEVFQSDWYKHYKNEFTGVKNENR